MSGGPLASPTPADRANSASANLHALFRAMSMLPGGRLEEGGHVARHLRFPTNPMFKGAWATRVPKREEDAVIDETIDWFRSRQAPYFFWWTGPQTRPSALGARLMAKGFISMEEQQKVLAHGIVQTASGAPVMTMDLRDADPSLIGRVPPGFAVREATSLADLDAFKEVFVSTYEIPEWAGQAWVDATMSFGLGRSPWRIFIGWLDGEAVATNILFNGGGVASVYAIATIAKVRGQGIGAAITLAPLLIARDAGYRYAALFSTEMGMPVYARIGFRDTGARIDRYLWRAG